MLIVDDGCSSWRQNIISKFTKGGLVVLVCDIGLGICTSSGLQYGCAPLEYQFATPGPQTPCVRTQFNLMINMSRFILSSSLVFL